MVVWAQLCLPLVVNMMFFGPTAGAYQTQTGMQVMGATTPGPASQTFPHSADYGQLDTSMMLDPTPFQQFSQGSMVVDAQHYQGGRPGGNIMTASPGHPYLTGVPQNEGINPSQYPILSSAAPYTPQFLDHHSGPGPADRDSSSTVDSQASRKSGSSRPKPLSANTISSWEYPYHCTFPPCTAVFRRKHEWKRHESSSHDPQFLYTCHLCRDREKPFTHTRRDKLGVHLQSAHALDKDMRDPRGRQVLTLEELESPPWTTDHPRRNHRWVCGFCQAVLTSWDARANHIAEHFQARCTMDNWRPGAGGDVRVGGSGSGSRSGSRGGKRKGSRMESEEMDDDAATIGSLVSTVKRLSTEDYGREMDQYDQHDEERYG